MRERWFMHRTTMSILLKMGGMWEHITMRKECQFCGKFEDGKDCSYEMHSKERMLCDEISRDAPYAQRKQKHES
jgi:hypothetical protein